MKKTLSITAIFLGSIILYSCTPKAAKTVTPSDSNEAYRAFVNNYNEQSLASGKTLYLNNCAKCHKLKDEQNYTIDKWDKILDRMIPKAKLSEEDGKLVRAYVYSLKLNEKK